MITYVVGNLFESPAQVLVNTVNTVGVMGKGIAKEFKQYYPDMYERYRQLCENRRFDVGQLWLYRTDHKWVLNFPTKKHWRNPSKLEYIEAGLRKFAATFKAKGISSVAFPMLGCGNGELNWESQVQPLMEKYLKNLLLDVYIYVYRNGPAVPEHRNPQDLKAWLHAEPASMPFGEVLDDLAALIGEGTLDLDVGAQRVFCQLVLDSSQELGLRIQGADWTEIVESRQLFEVWQRIRALNFFTPDVVPRGLSHVAEHLQALFSRLPYFRPVLLAKTYEALGSSQVAFQLVAPTRVSTGETSLIAQVEIAHEQHSQEA